LAQSIAEHILRHGPITFRDFMERALYEPGRGYYGRAHTPWSEAGDFVTAPQVDAALGVAVARLARECDAALGAPTRFDLVEQGGGDGILIGDVCDALAADAADLYRRLRVHCVERSDAARAQQRQRLAAHLPRVTWYGTLDEVSSVRGLLFSNELLDAFPVHRVVCREGTLREIFVDVEEGAFVDREMDPSTPELADYLRFNDVTLRPGQEAEICLAVSPWIEAVGQRLERGFALTIDYGAPSEALYESGRNEGTLVCQHRYQLNDRPYERVGEQDITAHVDLGNLRRRGEQHGLHTLGVASLAVFLIGFGAAADVVGGDFDGERAGPEAGGSLRRRLALRHLLFTEIGDAHRALLQAKDVEPIPFGTMRLE
jgi:SAM-dependent MidA family methyltransferase